MSSYLSIQCDRIRDGIARLLLDFSELTVIASMRNGEEAVAFVQENKVDVILIGLNMPDISGFEATRKISEQCSNTKIIILTQYTKNPFPAQLLEAGALGYLPKTSNTDEIVQTIQLVHEGKLYVSPKIAERLEFNKVSNLSKTPFDQLSMHEFQLVMKIVHAETVCYISKQLNLSTKAVNTLGYQIFLKLNIKNDLELIHLAIRFELLNLNPNSKRTHSNTSNRGAIPLSNFSKHNL